VERGRLNGSQAIRERIGKILKPNKIGKLYRVEVRDDGFDATLDHAALAAAATKGAGADPAVAAKRLRRYEGHSFSAHEKFPRIAHEKYPTGGSV